MKLIDDNTEIAAQARRGCNLTGRETQVLKLLAQGCSNQEIADALGIRFYTASTHLKNIFRKLGVRKRAAAVALALGGKVAHARPVPGMLPRHKESLRWNED